MQRDAGLDVYYAFGRIPSQDPVETRRIADDVVLVERNVAVAVASAPRADAHARLGRGRDLGSQFAGRSGADEAAGR